MAKKNSNKKKIPKTYKYWGQIRQLRRANQEQVEQAQEHTSRMDENGPDVRTTANSEWTTQA